MSRKRLSTSATTLGDVVECQVEDRGGRELTRMLTCRSRLAVGLMVFAQARAEQPK